MSQDTKRSAAPSLSHNAAYRRVAFPPERRLVLDTLRLGRHKPMMHGLLEIDVTRARRLLREHREHTGTSLSFTAFILSCLGKAAAAHPEVQALRDWRGRVVLFTEVDATTIVEVEVEGRPFAFAHVMRGIDHRGVRDIHDEIHSVQKAGINSLAPGWQSGIRFFLRVPGFLRHIVYRVMLRFPHLAKRHTGTILVTAVGMFSGGGWGLTAPGLHNLSIIIGGIASRPSSTPDEPGPREMLCLTVSANHELVDGAPLARFVRHLTKLIESADGLLDAFKDAEPAGADRPE